VSARRPSLDQVLIALARYPVDPEADEDLAEALRLTAEVHIPAQSNADRAGRYGLCRGCGEWWPCPSWRAAERAAQEWVWAAAQARMGRYRPAPLAPDPVGV
jgi:hypothetical protein